MADKLLFVHYCAKDSLDDTLTLDPLAELAYRRLVDMIYTTNDNLPDNDRMLGHATKTGKRWRAIKRELIGLGKIEIVEGRISNARCRIELAKSERNSLQKRAAGTASAECRKRDAAARHNLFKNPETRATATLTAVPTADQTAGWQTVNREPGKESSPCGDEAASRPRKARPMPVERAVAIWNEVCGDQLGCVSVLNETRRKVLASRLRAEFDTGNLMAWRAYCVRIAKSGFLSGANDRGWRASFDWAIGPRNCAKVIEGNYDDKAARHARPAHGPTTGAAI